MRAFGHLPASGRAGVHGGGCGSQPVCVPPPPRGNPPSPPCCDQGGGQGVGAVIVTPPKAPPTQRDTGTRMGTPQLPAFGVAKKAAPKRGQQGGGYWGGAARGVGALPRCPHHGTCPQGWDGSGAAPRWQLLGKEEEEEEEEGKNPGGGEEAAQSPRAGGCSLGAGDNLVPPRHRVPKS